MAIIEEIEVFYDKNIVGRIKIHDKNQLGFIYDPGWLINEGNFQLSVTLPLEAEECKEEIILPWLANLIPEGQQILTLTRVLGLSASDPIEILRQIGGDTAGAISIGEPSDRNLWKFKSLINHYKAKTEQEAFTLHINDLVNNPLLVGVDGVRISLAGDQVKSALTVLDDTGHPKLGLPGPSDRFATPKNGAPSTIIIKPDNPKLPYIVENEAYCPTLAKMIGI